MKKELTLIEQLSHSTVRIETDYPDVKRGTGTGFFYRFAINGDQHVPAIVTNRHVVEGASKGQFLLTLQDANGMPDHRE
jgi:S1-C subfamily serine protease